jgi:superfamily II DNA or RNA helicase
MQKLQIIIDNNETRIVGQIPMEANNALSDKMSYVMKGREHVQSYIDDEWDGVVRLFKPSGFLSGLLGIVKGTFDEYGVEYEVCDERRRTSNNFPELEFTYPEGYEKRDYQDFTVERSIQITRGTLNIATGGGKTVIVAKLIGDLKVKPFLFYTLTKDLLYQAKDVLGKHLNCKIGQIGDSKVDIQDVTVCTKDAVLYALNKGKSVDFKKYKLDSEDVWDESEVFGSSSAEEICELVRNCRGLYFDEVHHASATTCQEIINASPNAYWRFGGSATLLREDGQEIVIQGLFGRRIVNIPLSYLVKNGHLVPAGLFVAPVTVNHNIYKSYPQIYKKCVIDNEQVAQTIADIAIYTSGLGKSNLVLVSKIKHGQSIKKLIPGSVFLSGRDSSKKRNQAIEDMRTGKKMVLIATTLADEGLDITNLDIVHMAGAGASISRIPQRIGRIVRKRPGKTYGIAIYYHYCTTYLYEHGLKVKKIVKAEEGAIEIIQVADVVDLKSEIIRYMNKKETLFGELEKELE